MKKMFLAFLVATIIFSLITGCSQEENMPDNKNDTQESTEISVKERQRIDLYVAAMKGAFQEENGGNTFVAVKLDTLEGLSDKAKEEVLKDLSSLSPNVYDFEDVKNDSTKFELDANRNLARAIDGTLLWVNLEKYSENNATITAVSWFGNLGAVFPKYKASFKNGSWKLKIISMSES